MKEHMNATILIPPDVHEALQRLAERRHSTVEELVRLAIEHQYGPAFVQDRLEAVRALGELNLPAGTVEEMEKESISCW